MKKNLKEQIDQIQAKLVTLNLNDAEDIAQIYSLVEELIPSFKKQPKKQKSLEESITLLEELIFDSASDSKENIAIVQNNLSALQGSKSSNENLKSAIDEDLAHEFLLKMDQVLESIDELALKMEEDKSEENLNELKRIIHTLKGESGVLGLSHLEKVSHEFETHIEKKRHELKIDLVFQFKDWLSQSLSFIKKNGKENKDDSILNSLTKTKKKKQKKEVNSQLNWSKQITEDISFIKDFVTEATEHLQIAETTLLQCESGGVSLDHIDRIFRSFHTIKGISGFLNIVDIGDLTHEAENVLDMIRRDEIKTSSQFVDLFLLIVDQVKKMVQNVYESSQNSGTIHYDPKVPEIIQKIHLLMENNNEVLESELLNQKTTEKKEDKKLSQDDESIRISTGKLDKMINMVGELVIAQSMVNQAGLLSDRYEFSKNMELLRKVSRELQEISMSLRMIPLKSTFLKMSRIVRDIAKKRNKKVELVLTGEDTELDKTVVDRIGDPLIHMIRNAVDHGIENDVQKRIQNGKAEKGTVKLSAFHKGGFICLSIEDDGQGLDQDKILKKAIDKGLAKIDENYTEKEIYQFIFQPGFSTAKTITDVSGRGVGMDVVKKSIDSIRGIIEIESEICKGTRFLIKLPLTLAIIDGMVIQSNEDQYIIPTQSVITSFKPEPSKVRHMVDKGDVVIWQDQTYPLIHLNELFNERNQNRVNDDLIVLLESEGEKVGLRVTQLLGKQEVVIKNLGDFFSEAEGLSGGAIMPDGKVALILDVAGIIKLKKEGAICLR